MALNYIRQLTNIFLYTILSTTPQDGYYNILLTSKNIERQIS